MRYGLLLLALLAVGCASSAEIAEKDAAIAKRDAEIERLRAELRRAAERIERLEIMQPGRPYEIVPVPPRVQGRVISLPREAGTASQGRMESENRLLKRSKRASTTRMTTHTATLMRMSLTNMLLRLK